MRLKTTSVKSRRKTLGWMGSMILISATAVVLAPAPSAMATTNECDGYGVIGVFARVSSGASFDFNGRVVELQNERAADIYSRAEIKSGRQASDQVWIDRSFRQFSASTHGIISSTTAESQGWKQCGPFSVFRTQSVDNGVYAARACARMDGFSKCGSWYVD